MGAVFLLNYYTNDKNLLKSLVLFFEKYGVTNPQNAPNWDKMQETPQEQKQFPENKSLEPQYTKED